MFKHLIMLPVYLAVEIPRPRAHWRDYIYPHLAWGYLRIPQVEPLGTSVELRSLSVFICHCVSLVCFSVCISVNVGLHLKVLGLSI